MKFRVMILFLLAISIEALSRDVTTYLKIFPESIEVTKLSTIYHAMVANHITEGLFTVGVDNKIESNLIQNYKWQKNGTDLYFELNNRTFSDGVEITSQNVISALEECVRGTDETTSLALSKVKGFKNFINYKSKHLEGMKALSRKEVLISLDDVAPLLIDELAMNTCNIWKKNKSGNKNLLGGAVGTGDYFVSETTKDKIILKRREDRKDIKKPQKITFEKKMNENNLKKYDLFILNKKLETYSKDYQVFEMSRLMSHHLVLNNSIKPFNSLINRKLIAKSLNYKLFKNTLKLPNVRMQKGLIPLGIEGFINRRDFSFDMGELIKEFNKHGYNNQNPLAFKLYIRDTDEGYLELEMWQNMFTGFPVSVDIKFVKTNNLFDQNINKNYQAMRVGKSAGSIDPFRLLSSYHTRSPWNTAHSNLPECDQIIEDGIKVSTKKQRFNMYKKVDECLIAKHSILIPLATYSPNIVYVKKWWKLKRNNRYLLYPYRIFEWELNEK